MLVNLVVRTAQAPDENLELKIIALDKLPVKYVRVKVRQIGAKKWKIIEAANTARAVWSARLPVPTDDFEYQIVSQTSDGTKMSWPASAPEINQTVIIRQ
jgi:hypothetical protein